MTSDGAKVPRPRSRARRLLRWIVRGLLVLLAPFVVWGLAALVVPRITRNDEWTPPARGIEIGVVSNGVHTDLVLPLRAAGVDWAARLDLDELHGQDMGIRWVAVGWGDRRFYLETPTFADLKWDTALAAVSGMGRTAMHVTWLECGPYSSDESRVLIVNEEQYRELCEYVRTSFELDDAGRPRRIDHPGYTPFDHFYEAVGSYSAIQTCNEWTGAGLRRIGVRTGTWTPFASDVLRPLPR